MIELLLLKGFQAMLGSHFKDSQTNSITKKSVILKDSKGRRTAYKLG